MNLPDAKYIIIARSKVLAQASLKQRIDKAMCMKILSVWWRLMKILED